MSETIDDAIPNYAPLTRKQTAFTDAVIESGFEHGSIIAAYRSAYDWEGLDNGASVEAWKLLRHPKVAQRLKDSADAQGATTDRLISGILRRTEGTSNDATAISGYELLCKIRGLLGTPTAAAAAPTLQQNNVVALGTGALADVLGMLNGTTSSESGAATKAIGNDDTAL